MKVVLGLALFFVVLLGVALSLPFLVDLNKYQDRYRPLIEDALNRRVTLQDIRLTIWPRIGARVSGFTIQDDPAFRAGPFATLSSLDIGVKLLPLLRGKIEVEKITLRDPVIFVLKDTHDVLNVSTIGPKTTTPSKPEVPAPQAAGGPLRALALLAVDRVSIDGGRLTYRDEAADKAVEYAVDDLDFLLTSVHLGEVSNLHLAATIQPYNVPITLDGSFGPLTETLDIKTYAFDLGLGKMLVSLKGSALEGKLDATLTSPLISTADVPVALPLTKPVLLKDLHVTTHLESIHSSTGSPLERAEVKDLGLALVMGNSVINVKGAAANGVAHITAASSSIGSVDLPIALPLVKPVEIKNLHLSAKAKYPPRQGAPPLELADVTDLGLAVTMGSSIVDVQGTVLGGIARANVLSKGIHTADLPIVMPLKQSVEIRDIRLSGELHEHEALVHQFSMELFNGLIKAQGKTGTGSSAPPFSGTVTIEGVQLGPALIAAGTEHLAASGTAAGNIAIGGRGFTMPDVTKALEGAGRISIKDGKIEGINLMQEAAALLKVAGITLDSIRATVFSTIETDFTIKQGLVNVQKLLMESHDFQSTGHGTVGLDRTLNLRMNLHLSQALSQKIAASSPVARVALSGGRLSLPLIIGGTIHAPSYGLDTKMFAGKVQDQAKQKVREVVDDLLQGKSKPEDPKQQGKTLLKDLFGK
jgi:AsmA protein